MNTPLLCINGTKIDDCTGLGLAGWTINLLDADGNVIDTEITGADGSYSFCDLDPGTYSVEEVLQAGWQAVSGPTNPILLECGSSEDNDFVNEPLLCINGTKIDDCTGLGLAGWTINLLDADGNVIDTEITGADGSYSFCDLDPGTYSVEEVLQAGWQAVSGPTNPIVLECSNSENNDFVNTPLLCINGTKIDDCTGLGLAGWTINLLDADGNVIDTEITGADGSYSFCDLDPGTYSVEEVLQAGWQAVSGPTNPIVLECSNSENNDFVNTPLLCINGTKIDDCTGLGLAGWTINLLDADGNVIDTEITGADGSYSFCDLDPGTYSVEEVLQAGWQAVSGPTNPIVLECSNSENNDFVNTPLLCINGTKIDDCTGLGLAGWTINLLDADGNVIDTEITGADGSYSFCDLDPGTYSVEEVLQAGWQAVSGPTNPIVLECGSSEDNDFVNTPLLCIKGMKTDNFGVGLPGWTINLLDADGNVIDTEITGADGSYEFCGLMTGTYTVCEVLQDGWTNVTNTCTTVDLECEDSTGNDFVNQPEKECETAWAKIEPSTCFPGTGNWGWYTKITGKQLPYSNDGEEIWAGAAKCDTSKGTLVGTADVTLTTTEFHVTSDLLDSCEAGDLHVYVGYTPPSGPVGRYPYKTADVTFKTPLDPSKDIYIAVHWGDMCCAKCFYEETC